MRGIALAIVPLVVPAIALAQPEMRGPHTVSEWDAGSISAAGASIPTQVYFPEGASSAPTVIVMHGYFRNGSFHAEMARTLASRGFVVIVPDMPCGAGGCDHEANAMQLAALFDWAIAEAADASSMIAGMVDSTRLGLVGHSWGGLAVHLATAMDARVRAVVLLDPNDDGTDGLDVAGDIAVPNAQLLADVPGGCNSAWRPTETYAATAAPKLQVTVAGSGHCDPEEPGDGFCPVACGSGDPSKSTVFRRYTIAWMACFLAGDPAMAPWLGGASYDADVSSGVLVETSADGLDALPCAGAAGTDAGGVTPDGGGVARSDAGTRVDAGGAAPADSGTAPPADDDGGCGCEVPGGGSDRGWPAVLIVPIVLAARRARRW